MRMYNVERKHGRKDETEQQVNPTKIKDEESTKKK
jgi:hypothetical protein